jgi:serine/threonine protein kinase
VLLQLLHKPGIVSVALIRSPAFGKLVAKATYAARSGGDVMAAAEIDAAAILQDCSALLVPVDAVGRGKDSGDSVLVSQYAGVSIEQLMLEWKDDYMPARVGRAQQLLACMLLGLDELSKLPNAQIYGDFKLGNITYDKELQLFRLIDFGLMTAADKSNFSAGFTITHVAPEQAAALLSCQGKSVVDCNNAMATATSAASDVWALFLTALMPVLFGKLPRALEKLSKALKQQQGEAGRQAFLEAVAAWKPADSRQLMAIAVTHPDMADLFARGLAADPADRITVQQALQHPALADVVAQCRQRVAAAAPAVAKQRAAIRSLAAAVEAEQTMPATPQQLSDCSCRCSSSCDSSSSCGSTSCGSSSSSISHSMQSKATATAAALPAAAKATHAFGCFGGMRWRRWSAAKSHIFSSSAAASSCSSGKGSSSGGHSKTLSTDASATCSSSCKDGAGAVAAITLLPPHKPLLSSGAASSC